MDYAVQQFLNALSFGAEYALIALGLAIVSPFRRPRFRRSGLGDLVVVRIVA